MTPQSEESLRKIKFNNVAPEDEEWTAHIKILNGYTDPDRYLRHILQYARSGAFYPADMHVDLIKQVMQAERQAHVEYVIGEDETEDTDLSKGAKSRWGVRARNRVRAEMRQRNTSGRSK